MIAVFSLLKYQKIVEILIEKIIFVLKSEPISYL